MTRCERAAAADGREDAGCNEQVLYLNAGPTGSIHSLNDGRLSAEAPIDPNGQTEFSYPDLNWHIGNVSFGKLGPDAQRFNVTFTSEALQEDVEVVGIPVLELHLSSTQIDTDLVVKLQEQLPLDEASFAAGKQPAPLPSSCARAG